MTTQCKGVLAHLQIELVEREESAEWKFRVPDLIALSRIGGIVEGFWEALGDKTEEAGAGNEQMRITLSRPGVNGKVYAHRSGWMSMKDLRRLLDMLDFEVMMSFRNWGNV